MVTMDGLGAAFWKYRLITVLCVCLLVPSVDGRGGSRGGISSRSSRSSRSGSSRTSTSTRSSGAYRGRVSRGSTFYSSYISYIPSYRYTRYYTPSILGATYWYYYSQYGAYSTSYHARRRNHYDDDVYLCANYEANENDTVMGWFVCPLEFEPSNFTSCCGEKYAEFCCAPESSSNYVVGIVVGVGIAILVVIVVIYVVCKRRTKKEASNVPPIIAAHPPASGMVASINPAYESPTKNPYPPAEPSYPVYSPGFEPDGAPGIPTAGVTGTTPYPVYPPAQSTGAMPPPEYQLEPTGPPPPYNPDMNTGSPPHINNPNPPYPSQPGTGAIYGVQ